MPSELQGALCTTWKEGEREDCSLRVGKLPSLMDLDCVRGGRGHREWTGPWGYSPLSDDMAQARQISIKFLEEARKPVV